MAGLAARLGDLEPRSVHEVVRRVEDGQVTAPEAWRLLATLDPPEGSRRLGVTERELPEPAERVGGILREVDALVGLDRVKVLVRELRAFVEIQRRRSAAGLATEALALHMVFRGNPGTGKTTIARMLGRLFKEIGVLQKGHVVEVERADLVGEYIGHTAQKTREHVKRALGGVLFIDEAYSLARGGDKDFGKEAVDCLVKAMEDNRDNLIVILAGYRVEMDAFLRTNPGIRSRFPLHMDFPDYTIDELLRIADVMLRQRQYRLTTEARSLLGRVLRDPYRQQALVDGNARLVRNLLERAIRRQAVRLVDRPVCDRDDLMELTAADVDPGGRL